MLATAFYIVGVGLCVVGILIVGFIALLILGAMLKK